MVVLGGTYYAIKGGVVRGLVGVLLNVLPEKCYLFCVLALWSSLDFIVCVNLFPSCTMMLEVCNCIFGLYNIVIPL